MLQISITFHGDLPTLLARKWRGRSTVAYRLERRASIKDIIEALGVPHTEIDRLTVDGGPADFHHIPERQEAVEVFPVTAASDFFTPNSLRPQPPPRLHFIADANVGKLAKKLRLLGFDTLYSREINDDDLAETAAREERIVLSKDKGVLMRRQVVWGHLVRSDDPREQLIESVRLFNLEDKATPYSRCQSCNGELAPVAKEDIYHLLEPLTKKYYDTFRICPDCGQIYWAGSHREKIDKKLAELLRMTT